MAWDSRLLTTSRQLTLLITGIHEVYPILLNTGKLSPELSSLGHRPQFKAGLCKRYKPSKSDVLDLARNFGLKEKKPIEVPREPAIPADFNVEDEEPDDYDSFDFHAEYRRAIELEEEKAANNATRKEDQGFIEFSLSSSLNDLLNDCFLDILQYRLQYGFGWAGAEMLVNMIQKRQQSAETILGSVEV